MLVEMGMPAEMAKAEGTATLGNMARGEAKTTSANSNL